MSRMLTPTVATRATIWLSVREEMNTPMAMMAAP